SPRARRSTTRAPQRACRSKPSRRSARCRRGGISIEPPTRAQGHTRQNGPTSEDRIDHAMMALERAPLNNHTDRLADAERTDHRDDQEVACEREDRRLELESDG